MTIRLIQGDCLVELAKLPAESFDSCVCDPPYHLTSIVKRFGSPTAAPAQFGRDGAYSRASVGFMGKQWDGGDIAFRPETWAAVYRVLKPGAFLLAFAGTRTYHRMAVAIEDGGFVVRDATAWLYGQGMPKSHNAQAPEWKGWGTALKPAMELISVARKPLAGSVAFNLAWHGTGALNIDGCRIGTEQRSYKGSGAQPNKISNHGHGDTGVGYMDGSGKAKEFTVVGRWPANVIHDGSDEVMEAFAAFGEVKGSGKSGLIEYSQPDIRGNNYNRAAGRQRRSGLAFGDGGTVARFFYQAKATPADRAGSSHPTVKPIALMRHLTRLVTGPQGHVLDPFAGSGTTGAAALAEGFSATLIEREDEYADDIRYRFGWDSLTGAFRRNVKARKRLASALQECLTEFTTAEDL